MQHLGDLVLFLVILLAPVPACLWLLLIAQSDKGKTGFALSLLMLLTSWCVAQTSIGLILGIAHYLNLRAVLTAELLLFVTGVMLCRQIHRRAPSVSWRSALRWTQPFSPLETLVIIALVSVGVVQVWELATRPIGNYDSLWYHLPAMAKWYQTGTLVVQEQTYYERGFAPHVYPYNWELLCTLFLMPFREDFFVALPNLIAWAMWGLSVYVLSVQVGATRLCSLVAAALVMVLPYVLDSLNTMQVDLPFASFFLAGLCFAIACHRRRSRVDAAVLLATLGMLVGIKMPGPVYAVLIVAALGFMEIRSRFLRPSSASVSSSPSLKTRSARPLVGVGLLCCGLLGGFWYLRNWVQIGNPLGYVKVQIAGVVLFDGTADLTEIKKRTALSSVFQPTRVAHWKILAGQIKEKLHVPFAVLGLQAFAVPFAFAAGQRRIPTAYLLGLFALLFCAGFLYWSTPASAKNPGDADMTSWMGQAFRYAFPFIGLLGVAAAVGATLTQTRDENLVALALISSVASAPRAIYVGGFLLLGWGWFGAIQQARWMAHAPHPLRVFGRCAIVATCAGLMFGATFVMRQKRDAHRSQTYDDVVDYVTHNINSDEVIGYPSSMKSYLLYGKDLNRQVIFMPSKTDAPAPWIDELRQKNVRVIAFGPSEPTMRWRSVNQMVADLKSHPAYRNYIREFLWLEDPNGPFVRVFGDDPRREPLIYRWKDGGVLP